MESAIIPCAASAAGTQKQAFDRGTSEPLAGKNVRFDEEICLYMRCKSWVQDRDALFRQAVGSVTIWLVTDEGNLH